jgi:uncharacterized protein (DUF1810 family)
VSEIDLSRFVERHGDFGAALSEVIQGRKRTHRMWYIFPQVAGLGSSSMAQRYAIESTDEAAAFLMHPVLGTDYLRIVEAVWQQVAHEGISVHGLFGSPDDAKLVSSLTLFEGVARRLDPHQSSLATFVAQAADILRASSIEGLNRCATTEVFLASR